MRQYGFLGLPLGLLIAVCVVETLVSQATKRAFEVASIRRNQSGAPGLRGPMEVVSMRLPNGFRATNASVASIIRAAYSDGVEVLREDEIVAAPEWVYTDRFDISATVATEVSREQIRLMIQTLLEDRFGLGVTREDRAKDTYVLRVNRNDGRLGPDLRRAADNCEVNRPADFSESRLPKPSGGERPSFAGSCQEIAGLVAILQRTLNTTVVDQSGLSGRWDFVVAHSALQPSPTAAVRDDRPELFTAVREQLGLKLDREKGFVSVLVVKSVHQPTEN